MKKVGLVGFYGPGNFGDELMRLTLTEFLSDLDVQLVYDDILSPKFDDEFVRIIDTFDAIVIGGGDLLIPKVAVARFWHPKFLRKLVYVYGVGVPQWTGKPEANAITAYRNFFQHENVRLIATRDIQSANWMRDSLGIDKRVYVFPDITCARDDIRDFYIESKNQRAAPKNFLDRAFPGIKKALGSHHSSDKPKVLGLITRDFPGMSYENIHELCATANQEGFEVHHIVLGTDGIQHDDLKESISLSFYNRVIILRDNSLSLIEELSKCTVVVSMKFHGCLVALMMGRKTMALLQHDKFANLLSSINRPEYVTCTHDDGLSKKFVDLIDDEWGVDVDGFYYEARAGLEKLKSDIVKDLC